jgi:ribose transport system substrate-binding protein
MFASNESSTIGAARAIKERGLTGKVKLVGFDSSPSLNDDLRAGIIDSLVLQDPFRIGYEGMKSLLDHHAGKSVAKTIALPPVLVTHDNMSDPKMQQLLSPDIERYLKGSKP